MSQSGLGGERRYSVPSNPMAFHDPRGMQSEDLHAWSIYRQNLNSDFTDSALGSTDKSPLPYGNFQLRDTTVQSILAHPRYGPKSALGSNMYTYLKFGLPRVFPPNHNGSQRSATPKPKNSIGSTKPAQRISRPSRGVRETSSGYDSSDNETSMQYKHNRKYRSDPDFRMQNLHPSYQHTGVPLVAMHQAGIRDSQWGGVKNRSISEANLLAMENRQYNSSRQAYGGRRSSVAELGHELDHQSYLMAASQLGRPMSKTDSHLSLAHSRKSHQVSSTLRGGDYLDGNGIPHVSYIYPNLQVNDLEIATPESKNILLVAGLSFEVKAGELLAVLATAQNEATALLNILAGVNKKLTGEIIMNGQPVSGKILRDTIAYVRNDVNLNPDMTVEQTLQLHAQLRWPNSKMSQIKVDMVDRINILIEELGLEQVHSTTVGRLTRSELRRLNVACQLLLDTVILILDQPTKEMDIFDTFFLIEYLRNWASTGRIVIMTLHPPTYEIFAMISKVVLLSAGRTMFSGYRRDMLPYFSSIDYPCPSFKNPSDYYLDLVTLDELSAAAMLESSARIEQLAGAARALPRPPRAPHHPPSPLPPSLLKANPLSQMFTLFKMNVYYTQPNTIISWVVRLIMAATLSIMTGAIYWDLPSSDSQLSQSDRHGYHYSVMCLTVMPILIMTGVMPVWCKRKFIERDISIGLYGRTTYILTDIITDIPSSICTWLAFLIPSYAMTGLYIQGSDDFNGFYLYLGYMLLYLLSLQMLVKAVAFIIPRSRVSSIISGILLLLIFLSGGYILHKDDMPSYTVWLENVSPTRWTMPYILRRELSPEAIHSISRCKHKQIQRQDIIVQLPCPQLDGKQALSNYGYLHSEGLWDQSENSTLISLVVFWAVFALITCFAFMIDCCNFKRKSERKFEKSNKTTPNAP